MARVLYLVHRMPYPPNKGDKVRSYHLLRFLADRHDVLLGTFVDDPDDEAYVETVSRWCVEVNVSRIRPALTRVASLRALVRGESLTQAYYDGAAMHAWVDDLRARRAVDAVVVFSSSMAPYAEGFDVPVTVDFVDVDSIKWRDYGRTRPWPLSWVYRREGERLLALEKRAAARARHCFFVTDKETALFASLAPEHAQRLRPVGNGVDTDYFAPDPARPSPFEADELPIVFTGAMDYWPNVDAVVWFRDQVLPALRARWPTLRLSIVGRQPTAPVRALAGDGVRVTGTVDDVRPWIQHAAVVVAPLRLARGVQNKVLEAMAMGRPVVAASTCVEAIDADPGRQLVAATTAEDYVREITQLLEAPTRAATMGAEARARVQSRFSWEAKLSPFDACLEPS